MNKKQFSIQLCFDLASMISQFQIKNNKVRGLILSLDAAFIFQKIIKCMLRYVILIYFTVDSRVFGPKILWIRLCYPRIMIDYWAHTLSKVLFSPESPCIFADCCYGGHVVKFVNCKAYLQSYKSLIANKFVLKIKTKSCP